MADTHAVTLQSGKVFMAVNADGRGFSEALKGSNLRDAGAHGFHLVAGDEDGIDCVRGSNYSFRDGVIESTPLTRTFITLKGGIQGATLQNIRLKKRCRYPWDISLGDHTIYNRRRLMRQSGVVIDNVWRDDGRPVRILVMDSEKPMCSRGEYRIYRIPTLLVRIWMFFKG